MSSIHGFAVGGNHLAANIALQDSNNGLTTLVITGFFFVRKTQEPPIRPPTFFAGIVSLREVQLSQMILLHWPF
ncbi:hypothetical protein BJK05_09635 [Pectobacterium polaris]|nr:hypothetical protein BJK05_09635 [Pectobacterium polaris]